jgi:hypothetical protein
VSVIDWLFQADFPPDLDATATGNHHVNGIWAVSSAQNFAVTGARNETAILNKTLMDSRFQIDRDGAIRVERRVKPLLHSAAAGSFLRPGMEYATWSDVASASPGSRR